MATSLEIVDGDDTISLDDWCDFAKLKGQTLVGNMRFGAEILNTDNDEIIAIKRDQSAIEYNKFADVMEPFIGQIVTVIYEATKVATVQIPEDCGINELGNEIRWGVVPDEVEKSDHYTHKNPSGMTDHETEIYEAAQFPYEVLEEFRMLAPVMKELTFAVRELTEVINGKKKA